MRSFIRLLAGALLATALVLTGATGAHATKRPVPQTTYCDTCNGGLPGGHEYVASIYDTVSSSNSQGTDTVNMTVYWYGNGTRVTYAAGPYCSWSYHPYGLDGWSQGPRSTNLWYPYTNFTKIDFQCNDTVSILSGVNVHFHAQIEGGVNGGWAYRYWQD